MATVLGIALVVVIFDRRRRTSLHRLLAPDHVSEVARTLSQGGAAPVGGTPPEIPVFTTSLGVRLSCSVVGDGTRVYTLSGVEAAAAGALSSLILLLRPLPGKIELLERTPGLFHLLVISPRDSGG